MVAISGALAEIEGMLLRLRREAPKDPPPPSGPARVVYSADGPRAVACVTACPACLNGDGWAPCHDEAGWKVGVVPCRCRALRVYAERFTAAGVPGSLAEATRANFEVEPVVDGKVLHPDGRTAAVAAGRAFADALRGGPPLPAGILLVGGPGRGKSHLLAALAKAALHESVVGGLQAAAPSTTGREPYTGPLVRWLSVSQWASVLSEAQDRGDGAPGRLKRSLSLVPLLVLDELGDCPRDSYAGQVLAEILLARHDGRLPLLAATNYALGGEGAGAIASRLPPHVLSRLLGGLNVVQLAGVDWRTRGKETNR